ncbi:MAG: hypothetical protein KAG64_03655 [Bacteroidales bacterium]|nr:hypothetical protein [Bacteroidales bacterium]
MKTHFIPFYLALIVYFILFNSCATFKSNVKGGFEQTAVKNYNAQKVNVLFIFSHYHQSIGYDAIPILESRREYIQGFDNFFLDALNEISNIERYSTYTEFASDVGDSKRRALKDSLLTQHDITIRMKFKQETSFPKFFFGTIVSSLTVTIFPIRYRYKCSVEMNVYNSKQQLIKSYTRDAILNKWVQTLLIVLYPFHNQKSEKEELYVEIMHDLFKQIETEKILK